MGEIGGDILVRETLIIELKSVTQFTTANEVQLVNYLTATKIDVGLSINSGPTKVCVKRKYRTRKKLDRMNKIDRMCRPSNILFIL